MDREDTQYDDDSVSFDTAQHAEHPSPREVLDRFAAENNGSAASFLARFAKVALKPGKVAFDEFVDMRLWDADLYGDSDPKAFVGSWTGRTLCEQANFAFHAYALSRNKIASNAVLSAHGLPTVATVALHASQAIPGPKTTTGPQDLADALLTRVAYPIFCKPLAGLQSLGSASFDGCDRTSRTLFRQDGKAIDADAFARSVHENYGTDGYLIQPRLNPHDAVVCICQHRIASVRILTILDEDGPQILRACWKIPAGRNHADNYWRDGNLLAQIDLSTGRTGRAVTGKGFSHREATSHPDTGAPIAGIDVPGWADMAALALAGAAVMKDFGLIGWDMAATEDGAVIIEMNEQPDFILPQIADRRGILDREFAAFIERRQQLAKRTPQLGEKPRRKFWRSRR
jgi:hypothetical protein